MLNQKSIEQAQVAGLASKTAPEPITQGSAPDRDDDDELPEMTPNLLEFSKLPLRGYEQAFQFIQKHRDVYAPGASDALLVQAFTAEGDGKSAYAKQCVHQSLLLQYCEKLGTDGVRIFFKRRVTQSVLRSIYAPNYRFIE